MIRNKILRTLIEHPNGLGYNELKCGIYERSLRRVLPDLVKDGLITVEEKPVRGGKKKLHKVTDLGRISAKVDRASNAFESLSINYAKITDIERRRLLSKVFEEMIDLFFVRRGSMNSMRAFHKSVESGARESLNKKWLSVARTEREEWEKRPYGEYCNPRFIIRRLPVWFLFEDAKLAYERGHFLTKHHCYILTKLELHKWVRLARKNREWSKTHKEHEVEERKKEADVRMCELKTRFPIKCKLAKFPTNYEEFACDLP